jgi:hypothetical protein
LVRVGHEQSQQLWVASSRAGLRAGAAAAAAGGTVGADASVEEEDEMGAIGTTRCVERETWVSVPSNPSADPPPE